MFLKLKNSGVACYSSLTKWHSRWRPGLQSSEGFIGVGVMHSRWLSYAHGQQTVASLWLAGGLSSSPWGSLHRAVEYSSGFPQSKWCQREQGRLSHNVCGELALETTHRRIFQWSHRPTQLKLGWGTSQGEYKEAVITGGHFGVWWP